MMRRYSLTPIRLFLVIAATMVASLGIVSTASAVVINDAGNVYGIAPMPLTALGSHVTPVSTAGACQDPSLAPDLTWKSIGLVSPLCYHGGPVLHANETYVLTWDPDRRYWATTRQYVEQFLSDVGTGSGTFTSPYAITTQYTDGTGRAQNKSVFAGGCIDYGSSPSSNGGYTCQFGANHPSGTGSDYPANGCPVSGKNLWGADPNGPLNINVDNDVCLTDGQIRTELQGMAPQMGLPGGNVPGYSPLLVLLTPPGVEVCLDSNGDACSANAAAPNNTQTRFCSYHSEVNVGGTEIPYVVQPWTAQWGQGNGCDDPDAPNITTPVDVRALANEVGAKLVSPLSQGQFAAIVNPGLNGWYANFAGASNYAGAEINDNGCIGLGQGLDKVTVGPTVYPLQREFNNAGAIETDPNALPCIGWLNLTPAFVVPGPVQAGDNVLFDGSVTASTLMVHNSAYTWNFGDGTTGVGPSVYHQYANGGNYKVTLTVTDRGGNTATITQTVPVYGPNGQPVPTPGPGSGAGSGSGSGSGASSGTGGLKVHLQLLPQSLKSVLTSGILVRVSSNKAANGIATVWITRVSAKKAHIKLGNGPAVRIGLGTVSSITNGTVTLRLHLSAAVAKKLEHLHHVAMTVRLSLVGSGSQQASAVAAGRY